MDNRMNSANDEELRGASEVWLRLKSQWTRDSGDFRVTKSQRRGMEDPHRTTSPKVGLRPRSRLLDERTPLAQRSKQRTCVSTMEAGEAENIT